MISGMPGLIASWLRTVATARGRQLLLIVFCVDISFAFVFLVALQTYFEPQHLAARAVPRPEIIK